MSCPICGRMLCDHSPYERGQSYQEMMADMRSDSQKVQVASTEKQKRKEKQMDISQFRQTCRVRVRVKGGELKDIVLRLAHQDPEGLNDRPVGEKVYFDGEWHESKDVEVIQVLPWSL